jgi:proteic killer suppression protein
MILSYKNKNTEKFASGERVAKFEGFEVQAHKKLMLLEAATRIEDLRNMPGNRLEALEGDREGEWSIRINKQWRVCFKWTGVDAEEVSIEDYH